MRQCSGCAPPFCTACRGAGTIAAEIMQEDAAGKFAPSAPKYDDLLLDVMVQAVEGAAVAGAAVESTARVDDALRETSDALLLPKDSVPKLAAVAAAEGSSLALELAGACAEVAAAEATLAQATVATQRDVVEKFEKSVPRWKVQMRERAKKARDTVAAGADSAAAAAVGAAVDPTDEAAMVSAAEVACGHRNSLFTADNPVLLL